VFQRAGAAGQRGGQLRRIGNRAKGAVEDYVAGVRSRTGCCCAPGDNQVNTQPDNLRLPGTRTAWPCRSTNK
jgi:hypothetical protein